MRTYNQHYRDCKRKYGKSNANIYETSVHLNSIEYDYENFVTLSKKISDKLNNYQGCVEDKWAIKLNEWREINELEIFCQEVMPQIEERYFGCHVSVDFLHPYKVKPNTTKESSWEWHYDDCPKEFIKLGIYLNNTTENNGCMQYLHGDKIPVIETYRLDPTAIKGYPPPVFPRTRVPQRAIQSFIDSGGSIQSIVGEAGTNFIFTPNVVHRGTIPNSDTTTREAIFFFIRPSLSKKELYIDNNTNSFLPEKNVKKYELN